MLGKDGGVEMGKRGKERRGEERIGERVTARGHFGDRRGASEPALIISSSIIGRARLKACGD